MTIRLAQKDVLDNGFKKSRTHSRDELDIDMVYVANDCYGDTFAAGSWSESSDITVLENATSDRANFMADFCLTDICGHRSTQTDIRYQDHHAILDIICIRTENDFEDCNLTTDNTPSIKEMSNVREIPSQCSIDAMLLHAYSEGRQTCKMELGEVINSYLGENPSIFVYFGGYGSTESFAILASDGMQELVATIGSKILCRRDLGRDKSFNSDTSYQLPHTTVTYTSTTQGAKPTQPADNYWSSQCILFQISDLATYNTRYSSNENDIGASYLEFPHPNVKETPPKNMDLAPFCGFLHRIKDPFVPTWTPRLDDTLCIVQFIHRYSQTGAYTLVDGAQDGSSSTAFHVSRTNNTVKGTCQWIFSNKEYLRWREQRDGILWLSGAPGTGKSTLTSTVISQLQNDHRIGELIISYCADVDYKGVSPVTAILWQILMKMLLREPRGKLRDGIETILNDLVHIGNRVSTTRMKLLMSVIRHNLRKEETMYLLLDGLDEAGDSSSDQDLIKEFIDHASHPDPNHRIKCFVSTRPDFLRDRIPTRTVRSAKRVDLDIQQLNKDDLVLYVQDSLVWYNIPCETPESNEFKQKLATDAAGSFLWVRLVMNAIRYSSGRGSALKVIRNFVSSSIPIDLDKLYETLLDQISESHKLAALSMLKWVVHAARPLHVHELLNALHLQTGIEIQEGNVSDISSGLLTSNGSQIVRLAHSTVRGFLRNRFKIHWEGVSQEAHESITETCLRVLAPERLLTSLGLYPEDTTSDPDQSPQSLFGYAQRYWLFHYNLAEPRSSYLAGLLHKLLTKGLEHHEPLRTPATVNDSVGESSGLLMTRPIQFSAQELINIILVLGARFGLTKLVKLELDMGANVDFSFGPEELTPLMWASRAGHLDIVDLLLQYGADVHMRSSVGNTALLYAITKAHSEVVQSLLAHGAHPKSESPADKNAPQTLPEFSLSKTELTACTICGQVEAGYEISAHGNDQSDAAISPIQIPTEFVSEILPKTCSATSSLLGVERKAKIKWFSGAKMHKALKMAAKRGVEDIRKLLVLAGNDTDMLERSLSMSKLVSKLRVA